MAKLAKGLSAAVSIFFGLLFLAANINTPMTHGEILGCTIILLATAAFGGIAVAIDY